MTAAQSAVEVLIFGKRGFVGSLMFTAPSISIGRDARCMVRLNEPEVSKDHARLYLQGDAVFVEDLGSRTGTRVGKRSAASSSLPVSATDEVTIGSFRLRVTVHQARLNESVPPSGAHSSAPPRFDSDHVDDEATMTVRARPDPYGIDAILDSKEVTNRESMQTAIAPPSLPPSLQPKLRHQAADVPSGLQALLEPETAPLPVLKLEAEIPRENGPDQRPRDHDEDDEEDEDFVASFDLVTSLANAGLAAAARTPPNAAMLLEVIRFGPHRIRSVKHVDPRSGLFFEKKKNKVGQVQRDGTFAFDLAACNVYAISRNGQPLRADELGAVKSTRMLVASAGMQVFLSLPGGENAMVHFVPLVPKVLTPPWTMPAKAAWTLGLTSIGAHIGIALLVALAFLVNPQQPRDINEGRFATIAVKDIDLEARPPPPPPPPESDEPSSTEPTNVPVHQAPVPRTPGKKHLTPTAPMPHATAPPSDQPSASSKRLLSALSGVSASALDATSITNLDAVPQAAGSTAGFKVSGAIGKAPGDTLRIASSGGGGGADTKSATELGTNVGKVQTRAIGTTVRARVTASPQSIQGEGHLDRGEIQKVVNAHVYQIQGCYERQLMKDPTLAGKVVLEWVITPSGAVSGVRVRQSTVASNEVATCMQSAVKGWAFPQPQGGSITVTYPFAFRTTGP